MRNVDKCASNSDINRICITTNKQEHRRNTDAKSAVRSGLESVRIMSKHSNAPTRRRGKALPRHGRRVKAGCVKHRKPLSIILTASWPRSMSVFCSMCSCEAPSFLTIGLDLLYCKNMICLCT